MSMAILTLKITLGSTPMKHRTHRLPYLFLMVFFLAATPNAFAEAPNPFGNVQGENPAPPPPEFPEDDEFSPDTPFGFNPPAGGNSGNNQADNAPAPTLAPPLVPPVTVPSNSGRSSGSRASAPRTQSSRTATAPSSDAAGKNGKVNSVKAAQRLADYLELDPAVRGLEVKNFDLPDKDIKDVITLISKWTGKNFILDNKVRGKITIIGPSQVTLQEAYQAFLSALEANGLTTVQSGKFIRVIESAEARRAPVKTYAGDYAPKDDQFITRIFQLKYINADEVQREFRDLTTRQGKLFAYEPTNSIIITDTGSNIQRIREIVEAIDVKNFETTLHVLRIKNGSSKAISDMLSEIYSEKGGAGGAQRSFRRSALERTRGGGIISKIIPDESTNSLIVLANQAGYVQLQSLVARLDVKVTDTGRIHVYYCEYAKAEDLASTLSSLSSGGGAAGSRSSTRRTSVSTPNAAPGTTGGTSLSGNPSSGPVTAELEGGVKVTSDSATNSLVVVANSADYKTLRRVLKKLDIPRLQVFIETAIMEISLDDRENRGVNLAIGSPNRAFAGGFIGDSASLASFLVGGNPPEGATLPIFAGPQFTPSISGVGPVDVTTFMGLLNFVTTNTRSSILSTPQILALDNEKAEFKVQDEIPVQSTFTQSVGATGSGAVGTGNVTTLKTGIEIRLTPQINAASRTIRLNIEQSVDSVKDNNDVPEALRSIAKAKTSRVTNTSVIVRDLDYIMMSGLISDKVDDSETKVPLLGDIPILGWLFKGKKLSTKKTNLVILLRPKIIDTTSVAATHIQETLQERDEFIGKFTAGKEQHPEAIAKIKTRVEEQAVRGAGQKGFDYRNNQDDEEEEEPKVKPGDTSEIGKPKKEAKAEKSESTPLVPTEPNPEAFSNLPPPPSSDAPLLESPSADSGQ